MAAASSPDALRLPRRRRLAFMLTPIVDIMFLLLIFFMLTTQTSPYRMILLQGDATPAAPGPALSPSPGAPRGDLLLSISHLFATMNGEQVALDELPAALARYRSMGYSAAVAVLTSSATVQDVVTVLDTFQSIDFGTLRLVSPGSTS